MDRLIVTGGARLEGSVRVAGAKNSALKLIAASLLAEGRTVLSNVPRIHDCLTMGEVLEHLSPLALVQRILGERGQQVGIRMSSVRSGGSQPFANDFG
jgi:UDP-N-acetylglucosamine enolpyruvyl transferase